MTYPPGVRDLALRLGADPARQPLGIAMAQTGSMRLRLATDCWHSFTAHQTISVACRAFTWNARFARFGLLLGHRRAKPFQPPPWRGHFADYRLQQGRGTPFKGHVAWQIEGVDTPYWKGASTRWSMAGA